MRPSSQGRRPANNTLLFGSQNNQSNLVSGDADDDPSARIKRRNKGNTLLLSLDDDDDYDRQHERERERERQRGVLEEHRLEFPLQQTQQQQQQEPSAAPVHSVRQFANMRSLPPPPPPRPPMRQRMTSAPDFGGPVSSRAPVSSRGEAAWFNAPLPASIRMQQPLALDLDERRGWPPPSPTRGVAFAVVSFLMIGVAAAGTFFFLAPDKKPVHDTVSTTTITNASAPATPTAPTPAPEEATTSVPTVQHPQIGSTPAAPTPPPVITPNDLPNAKPTQPQQPRTTVAPQAANQNAIWQSPAKNPGGTTVAPTPAKKDRLDSALPDLDGAAAAAGVKPATPSDTDTFNTPHAGESNTTPAPSAPAPSPPSPAPTAPTTPTAPTENAPAAPSPSEVLPDLQIKR